MGNLLLDGGQMFIYLTLNKDDTVLNFNIECNYFGVAYFTGERLEGFEEVIATEQWIKKGVSFYIKSIVNEGIFALVIASLATQIND